jgi:FXSXX-COOH protein
MNSADTDPGIESELIDLSGISLDRLRDLDNTALRQAMNRALDRTTRLRSRMSSQEGGGERID